MKVKLQQFFKTALLFSLVFVQNNSKAQNSLDFDGTDDRVDCGTDTSVMIKNKAITLEAWIYPTAWKTNVYEGNIINKENNTNNNGYFLRCGASGKLNFGFGDNTTTWKELTSSTAVLTLNTWQHVAATYDGVKSKLYVNGVCTDSVNYSSSIQNSNAVNLTIGDHSGTYVRRYQGRIDEVRIWAVVRTIAEIKNNMNEEFCSKQNGLRAYYKFNHGIANGTNTVNKLTDWSGFKNTGSTFNFLMSGTGSNWVNGKSLTRNINTFVNTITQCDFFYGPTGKKLTVSGTYYDTIPTSFGCDSAIKTVLTIKKRSTKTINAWACKSYVSPSKAYTWTKTGKYVDYIKNWVGCDSMITVNLKIGGKPDTIRVSQCYTYTSPSKKYTFKTSGVYQDTIPDYRGCDSLITMFVTILNPTNSTLFAKGCKSYTSPSGKYTVTQSSTFYDTLVNSAGCDSIIKIVFKNLTGKKTINVTACEKFKNWNKKKTWTKSGIYYDTLKNYAFCDSIVTINLTINNAKRDTVNEISCRYFIMKAKPVVVNASGTYIDTFIAKSTGCDSIVTRNINIINIDKYIIHDGSLLTARTLNATYQWFNCTRNNMTIDTATKRSFVAPKNEMYGVIITQNGCIDTSDCIQVTNAKTTPISAYNFEIIPNPNKGTFTLKSNLYAPVSISILNTVGAVVYEKHNVPANDLKIELNQKAGIYHVRIKDENNATITKMVMIQ
jgi:hypothetical protein